MLLLSVLIKTHIDALSGATVVVYKLWRFFSPMTHFCHKAAHTRTGTFVCNVKELSYLLSQKAAKCDC